MNVHIASGNTLNLRSNFLQFQNINEWVCRSSKAGYPDNEMLSAISHLWYLFSFLKKKEKRKKQNQDLFHLLTGSKDATCALIGPDILQYCICSRGQERLRGTLSVSTEKKNMAEISAHPSRPMIYSRTFASSTQVSRWMCVVYLGGLCRSIPEGTWDSGKEAWLILMREAFYAMEIQSPSLGLCQSL